MKFRLKKPRTLQPREVPHGNTKYTDEDIIAVQRLAAEHGDELTLHAFRLATGIGTTTIQTRFGGWIALRERAGFARRKSYLVKARVHSASSLVAQLQAVVKKTGPHLNLMEFCEHAGVSSTTIQRYCGTWNKLRLAAGLPQRPKRQRLYSDSTCCSNFIVSCNRSASSPPPNSSTATAASAMRLITRDINRCGSSGSGIWCSSID